MLERFAKKALRQARSRLCGRQLGQAGTVGAKGTCIHWTTSAGPCVSSSVVAFLGELPEQSAVEAVMDESTPVAGDARCKFVDVVGTSWEALVLCRDPVIRGRSARLMEAGAIG